MTNPVASLSFCFRLFIFANLRFSEYAHGHQIRLQQYILGGLFFPMKPMVSSNEILNEYLIHVNCIIRVRDGKSIFGN